MTKIIYLALFLTVFAAACSTTKNSGTAANGTNANPQATDVTGKYWKLVVLEGQEVSMSKDQEHEAYFTLQANDSTIKGHGGCNTFNGTYKILEGNRIQFSKMATTLKACAGVQNEGEFLEVLNLADNYTIHNDTLWLNKARRAPLAGFKAVNFK